jgi:hypothetical protein
MIKRLIEAVTISVMVLTLGAGSVAAQTQSGKPPAAKSEMNNMEAAMRAAAPGPIHKQLAVRVGEYTTVTQYRSQPDAPPVESPGTARLTSVLGGRFLLEEDGGALAGQPTKGLRLWGYENPTKQFVSVWFYTMSTGIMTLTGKSNDEGKTVSWSASFNDDNGVKQTFDAVTRQIDNDRFVVGLYAKFPDGTRGPTFETTYTRKKSH